jgi:hypothetical protein
VAAAIVVVLGGGAALFLNGGNGAQPSGTVIFRSDFASAADGWRVLSDKSLGRLASRTYFIRDMTSDGDSTSVPTKALNVYPSAPPNIRIDVNAARVSGPPGFVQYGLVCRDSSNGHYIFQVQDGRATIAKFSAGTYIPLRTVSATGGISVDGVNQLSATCESVAGQQAVRLTFSVNGTQLLAVTDRTNPLNHGTVGIFANYYNTSIPRGVEAAFQNFEVRQL